MMILLFWAALAVEPKPAGCIAVDGEWVTAKDVTARIPALAESDPEARLIHAPFPGVRRLVTFGSLPPSVRKRGNEPGAPFCVERRVRPLSPEAILEAVRRALSATSSDADEGSGTGFEVVDFERTELPSGTLEFRVQTLPPPVPGRSEDPVLWRGKLYYAESRSLPVWVRVRLWAEGEACVVAHNVDRGGVLVPSDCKIVKTKYPPFGPRPIRDPAALERTAAARRLNAQEPLYPGLLVRKPDVEAGKAVELRVIKGGAQLRLPARAAASARKGETVAVTNPLTGKRLEGKVVGEGSVEVNLK